LALNVKNRILLAKRRKTSSADISDGALPERDEVAGRDAVLWLSTARGTNSRAASTVACAERRRRLAEFESLCLTGSQHPKV
jgi:hypothetical protein